MTQIALLLINQKKQLGDLRSFDERVIRYKLLQLVKWRVKEVAESIIAHGLAF